MGPYFEFEISNCNPDNKYVLLVCNHCIDIRICILTCMYSLSSLWDWSSLFQRATQHQLGTISATNWDNAEQSLWCLEPEFDNVILCLNTIQVVFPVKLTSCFFHYKVHLKLISIASMNGLALIWRHTVYWRNDDKCIGSYN